MNDEEKPRPLKYDLDSPEFTPNEECGLCGDTGVWRHEFRTEDEYVEYYGYGDARRGINYIKTVPNLVWRLRQLQEHGVWVVAEKCPCRTNTTRLRRLNAAGIPLGQKEAVLNGFRSNQASAGEVVKRFTKDVINRHKNGGVLLLTGPYATGKTYLACAALKTVIDHGAAGMFITSAKLCDELRERAIYAAETREWLKSLKTDRFLLVIDDLGAESLGAADGVVMNRYSEFLKDYDNGGWLIVTTNYDDISTALNNLFQDEGSRISARWKRRLYANVKLTR